MADPVVHITAGVPDSGTGNITTLGQTLLDGANITIGAKTDAKSTATDTTAASGISIWKQISASVQLLVFGAGTAAAAQRTTLASDDPAVATLGTVSGAAVITDANGTLQQYLRGLVKQWIAGTLVLGAGENHTGQVGGHTNIVDVTLSLDTSAYASGDVLADTQQVANALRVNDGTGVLHNVVVVDQDDQGVALDIYLLSANVTMGTENAAPSISDANAVNILGRVQVQSTDYYDLGGVKVANLRNLAMLVKAVSGTKDVYVAVVNGTGAPTYTASGIKLRLGFIND